MSSAKKGGGLLARTDIPESDWIGNSAASQTELKKCNHQWNPDGCFMLQGFKMNTNQIQCNFVIK